MRMQGEGGRRRMVSRRVLLAAGGATLLGMTAADGEGFPSSERVRLTTSRTVRPRVPSHTVPPARRARLPHGMAMDTVPDGPKVVALTLDDGPSPVYTPQVLRLLQRYGVTASFSMIGRSVAQFPSVAREVAAAGHVIVNHTWDHDDLSCLPDAAVWDEIARASGAIHSATGQRPVLFRAPYGAWPPSVFSCCARAGLTPLAWSVDPRDWSRPGVGSIVRDILSTTRTGSIILEHDGGGDRAQTVAALKVWLPRLIDEGYRFTTP